MMKVRGRVWKFGDDINTDLIIPARYLSLTDPSELGKHCMEDADPSFPQKVGKGDIIVAGKNFGCGSSREHAPIAIKAAGVSCVIAKSFGRIFYRNAFNMGLPILECEGAFSAVEEGDELEVTMDAGGILDVTGGKKLVAQPIPPFMQKLVSHGGLMNYVAEKVGLQGEEGGTQT